MYQVRDIITPIVEFIKTCPFADDFDVSVDNLTVQNFDEGDYESSSIEYTGSVMTEDLEDINARAVVERQANFVLWLTKKDGVNFYRKETADFLYNFEQWIEYCQFNKLTPKISNNEQYHEEEFMFASNGTFFSKYNDMDLSLYAIQLHVVYYNDYDY